MVALMQAPDVGSSLVYSPSLRLLKGLYRGSRGLLQGYFKGSIFLYR